MKGGKQTLGLEVASRVELDLVPDDLAYRLLVEQGRQLMGAQPVRALDRLEQAHVGRPSERTADGELALLKAYITADRWAMARSFVMDLAAHVRRHPVDAPRLIQAAVTWGDALYARGDYRAAADAYALAGDPAFPMNEERRWARYQRANALFETGDYEGSIELFDSIASGESSWAPHAAARARVARVRQRLMDEPVTPLPETGA
jgi:tetratricopeptide (TPR) repeat protein